MFRVFFEDAEHWRGGKIMEKSPHEVDKGSGGKNSKSTKKSWLHFWSLFFFFAIRSVYYEYFPSVIVVDSFSLSALRRRSPTKKRIKIIKRTAKSVYKKYNRLVLRLWRLFMCYVFDYRSWFLCFCRCCSAWRWLITMQKLSMENWLVTRRLHCRLTK